MELSATEPRRHRLTALFLDGEYAVSVDTETVLRAGWKPGREVTAAQLHDLLAESDARRASEKALYLLEHRSHSKKELADKIARTLPREAAQAAAQKMEDLGLIDDADYARRCAQALFGKGYARRRVQYELLHKGIAPELAEAAMDDFEPDPVEAACAVLEKKYPTLQDEKVRRRAAAALQRMGYSWEDACAAMRAVLENVEEDG